MIDKDREFQKKLLATFRVEAREHTDAISSGLIALEKASSAVERADALEALIREAHSLKGAARAVGGADIERVCQSLESVLAALRLHQLSPSSELFDSLHRGSDGLLRLLMKTGAESSAAERLSVTELTECLEGLLKGEPARAGVESGTPSMEAAAAPPGEVARSSALPLAAEMDTVRVSTAKLDAVLRRAEELFSARLAGGEQAMELRELQRRISSLRKEWTVHAPALAALTASRERDGRNAGREGGRRLAKLIELFKGSADAIESIEAAVTGLAATVEQGQQSMAMMVGALLEDMKKVLMQPSSALLDAFPKLVRDLSRDQGKEAELTIRGAEIEIDKRILEQMKDPLIHIIRNSIDHGIEKPEERARKGKRPRGRISIGISQRDGGNVELLIEDDGAGVDVARVKTAAARVGILSREQADGLRDEEALPLIFHSRVSTSPMITEVSGRGLGLAIAQEKVEKLGGRIAVEARPSGGTIFRIALPLTLATFRGITVRAGGRLFVLPTAGVERVVQVNREDIRMVEGRETLTLGEQIVSLVRLQEVLGISAAAAETESDEKVPAIVLAHAEKRIAVLVDEVIDEQEVLVKHLGSQLPRVRNIAGATVLGSGKTVPVLLVPDVIRSSARVDGPGPKPSAALAQKKAEIKRSILVVEDSITSRMLLKNIMESAGYEVDIAVDGIDAFTKLRSGGFDLVVSDVQMPRMNGFDLTAKIRADKKLAEMPVVLVTALESREDRERGIEVGANAYIVKSSFDQSNLLEVIGRLL